MKPALESLRLEERRALSLRKDRLQFHFNNKLQQIEQPLLDPATGWGARKMLIALGQVKLESVPRQCFDYLRLSLFSFSTS